MEQRASSMLTACHYATLCAIIFECTCTIIQVQSCMFAISRVWAHPSIAQSISQSSSPSFNNIAPSQLPIPFFNCPFHPSIAHSILQFPIPSLSCPVHPSVCNKREEGWPILAPKMLNSWQSWASRLYMSCLLKEYYLLSKDHLQIQTHIQKTTQQKYMSRTMQYRRIRAWRHSCGSVHSVLLE